MGKGTDIRRYAEAMGLTYDEAEARVKAQTDLFPKLPKDNRNPMIAKYGAWTVADAPDEKAAWKGTPTCGECEFFVTIEYHRRYFKCRYRGITNGAGTDHRKGWPACRLFEKATEATRG